VLHISDVDFTCNAYVLGFEGYELVLGMDWLSYYGKILDCDKGVVRLRSSMGHDLCIHYAPPTSHELGRLFSLTTTPNELSLVPVVKGFSDVFEEVFGLPPKREIELKIELEKDVTSISLFLRPMASKERRELEKQVVELLLKSFIIRSISEWRAPVVFATKVDSSLRLCVDFKALNKMKKKNGYPLLRIDDLFNKLDEAKVFS